VSRSPFFVGSAESAAYLSWRVVDGLRKGLDDHAALLRGLDDEAAFHYVMSATTKFVKDLGAPPDYECVDPSQE
jgi:hypothetical protein